jgi:hypothetical protein
LTATRAISHQRRRAVYAPDQEPRAMIPTEHRRTPSPELVATAYHESGHTVATVMAFRDARWLPRRHNLQSVQE